LDNSDKEIKQLKTDKETLLAGFNKLMEDYKICQAEPKILFESNSKNWYWYAAAGSAGTVIIYFIFKVFVLKK